MPGSGRRGGLGFLLLSLHHPVDQFTRDAGLAAGWTFDRDTVSGSLEVVAVLAGDPKFGLFAGMDLHGITLSGLGGSNGIIILSARTATLRHDRRTYHAASHRPRRGSGIGDTDGQS